MSAEPANGKPRVAIVCENYWPEPASTGQLITELAESLVPWFRVEVLTAQPKYNGAYARQPGTAIRNGVKVTRSWASAFNKRSRFGRLSNWLSFLAGIVVAVALRPSRTFLFVTNPPVAPWALLVARGLGRRSFVLVYDLYPDLAEAIGVVSGRGLVARAFDAVNKFCFRRADCVIALGSDMQQRLREKLGTDAEIQVIPNWANGELITPLPKLLSKFASENDLHDRFVFLYAGNLGLFQDLETLVEAVESLPRGEKEPALMFVGDGGKRTMLESLAQRSSRVYVHDYVPYEDLGDLYAAADVGLIALEPGVEKTNVPSKTYSILAARKPFLAVCASSSDLEALAEAGCGICVPNDAEAVSRAMAALMDDTTLADAMGRRGREVFEREFSREVAVRRYRKLLQHTPAMESLTPVPQTPEVS